MKKILSTLAVLFVIGIFITPIIYTKQVNKVVTSESKNLQKLGVFVKEVKSKDSFFNIKRDYIVTIKDITPLVKKEYSNVDSFVLSRLKSTFDNSKFLVSLNIIKYPIYHKNGITAILLNLNKIQSLNTENIQIVKFIKNKNIELNFDIDQAKIVKVKLKDINFKLVNDKNKTMQIVLNKFNILLENKIITSFDKFIVDVNGMNISIDKFTNIIKKQTQFNYTETTKINNFKYNIVSKINVDLDKLISTTKINTIIDKVNFEHKLSIKKTIISSNKDYIKLNKIVFNTQVNKLYLPVLKELVKTIKSKTSKNKNLNYALNSLLNKGFELKLNPVSFDKTILHLSNKDTDILATTLKLNVILKPNTLNIPYFDKRALFNKLDGKINLETAKQNISLITKINPLVGIYLANIIKYVGNKAIIDILYKNGHFISNGKRIF